MIARQDVIKLLSLLAVRLNAQSAPSPPRQFGGLVIRGTGINTTTTPFIARSHLRYGSGGSTSTFYTSAVTPFNVTGEIIPLFSQFAPPAEGDCDPNTWGLPPQAFQGKIVFTFFTYITYYCDMSLWKQLGVIGVMMASPDASAVGFSNTVSNNIPDIPVVFVNTDSIGLLMVSAMSGARARITNGDSCEKYGTDGSGSLGVQIYLALMGAIALAMAIFFTVKGPQVFLRKNQNCTVKLLDVEIVSNC